MTMTLMGHDIILQRPSRTFYNDKKAKAPARALTHQLVLFVFYGQFMLSPKDLSELVEVALNKQ